MSEDIELTEIKELETANPEIIQLISELHKKAFPSFFLTQLGIPFLKTLYEGYAEDNNSGIITAEENGKLVGFIAYSSDYPEFYKGLIKNHLLKFALCSFGVAVRHPSFIKRIFGAFKKSESVKKEDKYVELASICVDPESESKGLGTELIGYLKSIVDFDTYSYINLETDADNNDRVNRFYEKNGFVLSRQYETPQGRKMNEYRYSVKTIVGERT